MGTDKSMFRPACPWPGMVQGQLVPGLGAQIFARAPTKSYVQTSARAQDPDWGTYSDRAEDY